MTFPVLFLPYMACLIKITSLRIINNNNKINDTIITARTTNKFVLNVKIYFLDFHKSTTITTALVKTLLFGYEKVNTQNNLCFPFYSRSCLFLHFTEKR
jgi:hypothetical protein